jgi:DNA polymerase I-like protein with 3'-5' exonuclease and polymerase domains
MNWVAINHNISDISEYYLSMRLPSIESLIGAGRQKLALTQSAPEAAMTYLAPQADIVGRLHLKLSD